MNDVAGSINARCADRLREAADLLDAQGANPFRVSAYRKAAATVLGLPEDVARDRRRATGCPASRRCRTSAAASPPHCSR